MTMPIPAGAVFTAPSPAAAVGAGAPGAPVAGADGFDALMRQLSGALLATSATIGAPIGTPDDEAPGSGPIADSGESSDDPTPVVAPTLPFVVLPVPVMPGPVSEETGGWDVAKGASGSFVPEAAPIVRSGSSGWTPPAPAIQMAESSPAISLIGAAPDVRPGGREEDGGPDWRPAEVAVPISGFAAVAAAVPLAVERPAPAGVPVPVASDQPVPIAVPIPVGASVTMGVDAEAPARDVPVAPSGFEITAAPDDRRSAERPMGQLGGFWRAEHGQSAASPRDHAIEGRPILGRVEVGASRVVERDASNLQAVPDDGAEMTTQQVQLPTPAALSEAAVIAMPRAGTMAVDGAARFRRALGRDLDVPTTPARGSATAATWSETTPAVGPSAASDRSGGEPAGESSRDKGRGAAFASVGVPVPAVGARQAVPPGPAQADAVPLVGESPAPAPRGGLAAPGPLEASASAAAASILSAAPGLAHTLPLTIALPAADFLPGDVVVDAPVSARELDPAEGAAVHGQIVRSLRLQWTGGLGEARVTLRPEFLGEVVASITVDRGVVTATLQADTPEVRRWMEQHTTSLREALVEHGLRLDRLTVAETAHAPSDDERQSRHRGRQQDAPPERQRRRQRPEREFQFDTTP